MLLRNYFDYPVTSSQSEAVNLLRDDFTRAVILRKPELNFESHLITDMPGFSNASKYWEDSERPEMGRRIPGETLYTLNTLTPQVVLQEATYAGLIISSETSIALCSKMHLAIHEFSAITAQHMQNDNFYMRNWLMFAPPYAQGRSPLPHLDRTPLTALWYAARAPLKVYVGELTEQQWKALVPTRKDENLRNDKLRDLDLNAKADDYLEMPVGPLIIARNTKNRDLYQPEVRRTVCVHKSGDIWRQGQAGLIMVPKFMD